MNIENIITYLDSFNELSEKLSDNEINNLNKIKQKINNILLMDSKKDILTFENFNPNVNKFITGEEAKKIINNIEKVIDMTHLTADENKVYRV